MWRRFDGLVQGSTADPSEAPQEFVHRIDSIDRVAHGCDNFAFWNVQLDLLTGVRSEKNGRTNLDDWPVTTSITKMARVPLDSLVLESLEEMRILDVGGHIPGFAPPVVLPGQSRAPGPDSNNAGEPHRPYYISNK